MCNFTLTFASCDGRGVYVVLSNFPSYTGGVAFQMVDSNLIDQCALHDPNQAVYFTFPPGFFPNLTEFSSHNGICHISVPLS